jgi:hypothetical protein
MRGMRSWRPRIIQGKFWNTYAILAVFFFALFQISRIKWDFVNTWDSRKVRTRWVGGCSFVELQAMLLVVLPLCFLVPYCLLLDSALQVFDHCPLLTCWQGIIALVSWDSGISFQRYSFLKHLFAIWNVQKSNFREDTIRAYLSGRVYQDFGMTIRIIAVLYILSISVWKEK